MFLCGPRTWRDAEAEIALPGLDPAADGIRVLLITDIHAGPFVSPRVLAGTFRRLLGTAAAALLRH